MLVKAAAETPITNKGEGRCQYTDYTLNHFLSH
jgi:hypothetical protein